MRLNDWSGVALKGAVAGIQTHHLSVAGPALHPATRRTTWKCIHFMLHGKCYMIHATWKMSEFNIVDFFNRGLG